MTPEQNKLMEQCRKEAEAKYLAPHDEDPSWHEEYIIEDIIRCERSAYAQALYDERSKAKAPQYTRQGPPIQMQDVLLACGELNERERVAVQWVLDRANEEIGKRLTVEEIVRIAGDWFNHVQLNMKSGDDSASDLRSRLTAAISAKSKP